MLQRRGRWTKAVGFIFVCFSMSRFCFAKQFSLPMFYVVFPFWLSFVVFIVLPPNRAIRSDRVFVGQARPFLSLSSQKALNGPQKSEDVYSLEMSRESNEPELNELHFNYWLVTRHPKS